MSLSQGIDIVSVKRFRKAAERGGERFLNKIFTPAEINYCKGRARRYEHYAARFAAKEALIKALEASTQNPAIALKDIQIKKKPTGQPFIHLQAKVRRQAGLGPKDTIFCSLTHESEIAIATVLIQRHSGKQ